MMLTITLFLVFATVALIGYSLVPAMISYGSVASERREQKYLSSIESLLPHEEAKKRSRLFIFAPVVFAGGLFILFPAEIKPAGIVIGIIAGIIFPGIYIKTLHKQIRDKFNGQLIDALMIMSSSFRGGLSLVQALEAVVEEMPDPIRQEIGTVLGENKMGVALEEAMNHLYNRMPSAALQQMITAILLARETGGNLPVIFTRIVNNIRENKKIQQSLDTLTIQGKIQGVVMSILPIAFAFVVYSTNRRIFEHMFNSDTGRTMLMYAVVSECIGAFMIWKISTSKEY